MQLKDVTWLQNLANLTTLDLSECEELTDLTALAGLTTLTTLSFYDCQQLRDVTALAGLAALTTLDLGACRQLKDVIALAGLTTLTTLSLYDCRQLRDVTALAGLTTLTTLNLSRCEELKDVTALAGLTNLTTLDLSGCEELTDVTALAGLTTLTTLNLSRWGQLTRQLTDVTALQNLTNLTTLDLSGCEELTDLTALAGLTKLTTLNLRDCRSVSDLTPLGNLTQLTSLDLCDCQAKEFRQVRSLLDTLTDLRVYGSQFLDLHPAVCGKSEWDNAIDPVRRYCAALEPGAKPDAELKVFVLGNGGAGKTKLVGRLLGRPFDSIPEGSTHGIGLPGYFLPDDVDLPHPVRLAFWDFGGQDVYHGTHALFLRAPAIYVLIYSHDTENEDEFLDDNGVPVKNRRLGYWFDYLRQVAGDDGTVNGPVLLVQSKCDTPDQDDAEPPDRPEGGFPDLSKLFHVSSKGRGRGLADFGEKLHEAAVRLLNARPQPPLPRSWANVRQTLRVVQQGQSCPTMVLGDLAALCAEHGCAGDEVVLRDAFHEMGVVFYSPGVFDERIILDQSWALRAVYTVFTRDENFRQVVRHTNGRFTRDLLYRYFWSEHPVADQQLFLSFMTSCHICFRLSCSVYDDTAEYVAPDLLEPWCEREAGEFAWQRHLHAQAGVTVVFGLLHDGILRAFLAAIGRLAGDRARYWKFGCSVHDRTTGSQAMIQTDGNAIHMRAWYGDAPRLLQTLVTILEKLPLGRKPTPKWDGSQRPPLDRNEDFRLDPVALPAHKKLEDEGTWVRDYLQQLRMFYLIGCMFNEGATSLGDVAKKLTERKRDGGLPWNFGVGKTSVHNTISILADKVFCRYFGKKDVESLELFEPTDGRGSSKFNEDYGWRAWRATCEYLRKHDTLPPV